MGKWADGIADVLSGLINRRNGVNRSQVSHKRLSVEEMRTMYKSGLISKIVRLKSGYALNDTIKFESTADKEFYETNLAKRVKKATKFMLGFGRGIIVVFRDGDDLSTPLGSGSGKLKLREFSGDMVTATSVISDLRSDRYYRPVYYIVNGFNIHHSRVADFSYYEPVERERADYNYGGLSESELIYSQFINDEIVQRATGSIVDKASTFIYKIKGYKDLIHRKQESAVVQYVSTCEDGRSIYGGLITDADDMVEVVSQSIADLDKVDNITLRRIAMVTGLGMTVLIGEQASGLNSSGEAERQGFQDTIENLQSDYLLDPINFLAKVFGLGEIEFKENQGQSSSERIEYDTKAVAVAKTLWEMGEDHATYLKSKDVVEQNDWETFWSDNEGQGEVDLIGEMLSPGFKGDPNTSPSTAPISKQAPDVVEPEKISQFSLNGAQVTALLDVISKVNSGELTKDTAIKVLSTSFPISTQEARTLLSDVDEGEASNGGSTNTNSSEE